MTESRDRENQAVRIVGEKDGKYLTFQLANEEYGIGILKVKEIIGLMPITSVPQTPIFIKGVIIRNPFDGLCYPDIILAHPGIQQAFQAGVGH